MPKMKTHSSSKKRFKAMSSGKVKRYSAFRRHLMASKTQKQKRQSRRSCYIGETDIRHVRTLLPYA